MTVCPPGWTNEGDFREGESTNCDVSKIFVRVVYSFPVLLFPIAIFHSGRALLFMYRAKGLRGFLKIHNNVKTIHVTSVLASIFLLLSYLAKTIEPERALGIDPIVTWLFFVGMTMFFIGLNSSFAMFVKISIKQEKFGGRKSIVHLLKIASNIIPVLSTLMWTAFLLVLVAVYVRPHSIPVAVELVTWFWRLLAIAAISLLITVPFILHSACRDLKAMIKRNPDQSEDKTKELEQLLAKFQGVRAQALVRGTINSAFFLTLGISEQARYWGPYLIGIQAFLFSLVVLGLSTLTTRKSTGSSQQNSSNSSKAASKTTTPRVGSKISLADRNGGAGSKEESMVESKNNRSSKVEDVVAFSPSEPSSPTGETEQKHRSLRAYMFG